MTTKKSTKPELTKQGYVKSMANNRWLFYPDDTGKKVFRGIHGYWRLNHEKFVRGKDMKVVPRDEVKTAKKPVAKATKKPVTKKSKK